MYIPPHAQQSVLMVAKVLTIITADVFAQRLTAAKRLSVPLVRTQAQSKSKQDSPDSLNSLGREDDPGSS